MRRKAGRAGFVANAHGGFVLIEEAGVHAQSDLPPAVRPLDRAEQAPAAGVAPDPASAALAKGLSDLTEIVTQAEALLRAQGTLKGTYISPSSASTTSRWRCACTT